MKTFLLSLVLTPLVLFYISSCSHHVEKPSKTFVLVHGAWQASYVWEAVKEELENRGQTVVTVELPAHGSDYASPANVSINVYSDKVVEAINGVQGKVILVGHSMGGVVVSAVAEKIPEKIEKLIYIGAFVPANGQSLLDLAGQDKQSQLRASIIPSKDGLTLDIMHDNIISILCQDAPEPVQDIVLAKVRVEPAIPVTNKVVLTEDNYGKTDKYYIHTLQDHAIGSDLQNAMVLVEGLVKKYPPVNVIHRQDIYFTLGQTYNHLKHYDQAERYMLRAESLEKEAEVIRGPVFILELYKNMADFYLQRKEYEKSRLYYNKLLSGAGLDYQVYYQHAHASLFKIDSAEGHYISAIKHYQEERRVSDSVSGVTASKQIHELSIQYKTEQKDQNIKLLTKQGELQKAQLTQATFNNNIIIGGSVMLVALLLLLYNRYRQKQKSNKLLQLKQEEINQKNARLQGLLRDKDILINDKDILLEEKEWLLKEIHHRVKNNLQIMISLLNTQSKYLDGEEAINAITESKSRMQAMSLVHQKLYQLENSTSINMQTFITEFTDYLKTGFSLGQRIDFNLQVSSIDLDISQAIPLSLILNETITNAIKYAFTNRDKGVIQIIMQLQNVNYITLEISDDGKGFPEGFDVTKSDSMGVRLLKGLVRQIGGTLIVENKTGASIHIKFRKDTVLKSISKRELATHNEAALS